MNTLTLLDTLKCMCHSIGTLTYEHVVKVKVKVTLVQALRLCTGRTAHRGSRGIALPFLDHGTRRGWGVSVTPRPLFTPGKTRYPLYRRLCGPQGRSGQVRKTSPPPGSDPRSLQPVASRYTDWTVPVHEHKVGFMLLSNKSVVPVVYTVICLNAGRMDNLKEVIMSVRKIGFPICLELLVDYIRLY